MLLDKFPKKWHLRFLCIFIAVAAIAGAQAQEERTPGRILPSEYAGILLMESRVKTVINLRTAQELASLGFDEKAVVEEAGMTYIHTPMGNEIPDASTMQKILSALDTAKDSPVLLHCSNSNRAGAIWSLYAGQRDKLPVEEAIAEGKNAGMSAPTIETAVRKALRKVL